MKLNYQSLFATYTGTFSHNYVTSQLQERISILGLKKNYKSYLFQIEAAISARWVRSSKEEIQLLG